jgi:hypothetical protein
LTARRPRLFLFLDVDDVPCAAGLFDNWRQELR